MKILITGSEGTIGRELKKDLGLNHELILLDSRGGERVREANVCSLESILPHFEGVDTVIHLAAEIGHYPWEAVVTPNLTGTRNVYEAAVEKGVKRVVYASSTNVYQWDKLLEDFIESGKRITFKTPTVPFNDYGITKLLSEEIGKTRSLKYGINVVNLRLGSVTPDNKPLIEDHGRPLENDAGYAYWLSKRDCCNLFSAALSYRGYISIPCTSANDKTPVDLRIISNHLSIAPRDNSERFSPE